MKDAYDEKSDAQKEQLQAKFDELVAKIKEAGADGKIFIKEKIADLQSLIQ